jgi:hypothetical protein
MLLMSSPLIKKHIALLFSQMSLFEPEMSDGKWTGKFLVNQNKAGDRPIPERDDLLNMIGAASNELVEFIREHKQTVDQAAQTVKIIVEIYAQAKAALGPGEYPEDVMQLMGILFDRYRGAINCIHAIAHDIPYESSKRVAANFLAFKPERFQHLVNQNTTNGEQPQTNAGQSLRESAGCTCQGIQPAKNEDPACPVHGNRCAFCGEIGHFATSCASGPRKPGLRVLDVPPPVIRQND